VSFGRFYRLIADNADLKGWSTWLRSIAGAELAEYSDLSGGVYRAASFASDAIETRVLTDGVARLDPPGFEVAVEALFPPA